MSKEISMSAIEQLIEHCVRQDFFACLAETARAELAAMRDELERVKGELLQERLDAQSCRCLLGADSLEELREDIIRIQCEREAKKRQLAAQSADILKLREQRGQLSGVVLNFKQFLMLNGVGMNAEQRERVIQNISNIISEIKTP